MALGVTTTLNTTTVTGDAGVWYTFTNVYDLIQSYGGTTASSVVRTGNTGSFTYSLGFVPPSTYRRLIFGTNANIIIESGSRFIFTKSITTQIHMFEISENSRLQIQQGCVIDLDVNRIGGGWASLKGHYSISGVQNSPVIFQNMGQMYFYLNQPKTCSANYLTLKNITAATNIFMYMYSQYFNFPITFSHLTITNDNGNNWGYPMRFDSSAINENIIIDDFTISNVGYATNVVLNAIKFKNGFISNSVGTSTFGWTGNSSFNASYLDDWNSKFFVQSFPMLQNIYFKDCTIGVLNRINSCVYVKNCTFERTAGTKIGMQLAYGATILQTGSTFVGSITPRSFNNDGYNFFLKVHQIGITVVNTNSVPIEGSSILVKQSSSPPKQVWSGITNANGQLDNLFGNKLLLAESEQTSSAGGHTWSADTSGALYHSIIVSYPGYVTQEYKLAVTSSVDLTIQLQQPSTQPQPEASLTIVSDPSGALIWYNGSDMGLFTPETRTSFLAGTYSVQKDGYTFLPSEIEVSDTSQAITISFWGYIPSESGEGTNPGIQIGQGIAL